jgi:hypothetical protein
MIVISIQTTDLLGFLGALQLSANLGRRRVALSGVDHAKAEK